MQEKYRSQTRVFLSIRGVPQLDSIYREVSSLILTIEMASFGILSSAIYTIVTQSFALTLSHRGIEALKAAVFSVRVKIGELVISALNFLDV